MGKNNKQRSSCVYINFINIEFLCKWTSCLFFFGNSFLFFVCLLFHLKSFTLLWVFLFRFIFFFFLRVKSSMFSFWGFVVMMWIEEKKEKGEGKKNHRPLKANPCLLLAHSGFMVATKDSERERERERTQKRRESKKARKIFFVDGERSLDEKKERESKREKKGSLIVFCWNIHQIFKWYSNQICYAEHAGQESDMNECVRIFFEIVYIGNPLFVLTSIFTPLTVISRWKKRINSCESEKEKIAKNNTYYVYVSAYSIGKTTTTKKNHNLMNFAA